MLEIQKYLQTNKPEQIEADHGITIRRHTKFPNLIMFKYNQIEAKMDQRIVQECRGIILDESNGWAIISYPYDKFFNLGEGNAAQIDWASARVYEKLDGSIMTLYYYNGWRVASSGLPDASGQVNKDSIQTFDDMFWRTFEAEHYKLPDAAKDHCFIFELCTPYNRIVVPYKECSLTLHGVRNLQTLQECDPIEFAKTFGFRHTRMFPLTSVDECKAAADVLKPMEQEGYVVCDKDFHRVKIKSPKYVALAHIKDEFSARRIIELIRHGEDQEFLVYFPELRAEYDKVENRYKEIMKSINDYYLGISAIKDQKEFAIAAVKMPYSSVLFEMRKRDIKPEAFMKNATIYYVERLLERV